MSHCGQTHWQFSIFERFFFLLKLVGGWNHPNGKGTFALGIRDGGN
jgi:hypothetical protein